MHFVQGEEPPHFTTPTCARIENHSPGQWIGCQGPTQLPGLTPCSFTLWGWVKDEVHLSKPGKFAELQQKIQNNLLLFLSALFFFF
jgi:hypothetical protein